MGAHCILGHNPEKVPSQPCRVMEVPVLAARAGQTEDAAALHGNWTAAWSAFGWLPELFDASVTQRHPLQTVSPRSWYWDLTAGVLRVVQRRELAPHRASALLLS